MFEVGKRYMARNGDYSIRVMCLNRSNWRVTFLASASDSARYFGKGKKFTKLVDAVEGPNGEIREIVRRVDERHPGCDWSITDEEIRQTGERNEACLTRRNGI